MPRPLWLTLTFFFGSTPVRLCLALVGWHIIPRVTRFATSPGGAVVNSSNGQLRVLTLRPLASLLLFAVFVLGTRAVAAAEECKDIHRDDAKPTGDAGDTAAGSRGRRKAGRSAPATRAVFLRRVMGCGAAYLLAWPAAALAVKVAPREWRHT